MMKKLAQVFKRKQTSDSLVYSRVVADPDKTKMTELLRVAAKKANEDQRALASGR